MENLEIWRLLAGLGIFLFGMFLLEESIKALSGRSFKIFIRRNTHNTFRSILTGTSVTAILQSSSAVSLMTLAFVGAGIISLENSIGVILGSNLGTTITAWVIAVFGFKMKIEAFTLPIIGVGGLGIIFLGKSERYSNLSKMLVSLGLVFMGLDYMKGSVEGITATIDIETWRQSALWVFLMLGLILTALMQSSSATIAIFLTALNSELITLPQAAVAVIGANVGTTVTIGLGSIGGNIFKKRLALSHFLFNVMGAIVALIFLPILLVGIKSLLVGSFNNVIALSLFHTIFNLIAILIFLPFLRVLSKLLVKLLPEKKLSLTRYVDQTDNTVSEAALVAIRNEGRLLLSRGISYNMKILKLDQKLVFEAQEEREELFDPKLNSHEQYEQLKLSLSNIVQYSGKVQKNELALDESQLLHEYLLACRQILDGSKLIKDIHHNLEQFQDSGNDFLLDQYDHFRNELLRYYIQVQDFLRNHERKDRLSTLLGWYKELDEKMNAYVQNTLKNTRKGKLSEMEISDVLTVNRMMYRSRLLTLSAIKSLYCSTKEGSDFEMAIEVKNVI